MGLGLLFRIRVFGCFVLFEGSFSHCWVLESFRAAGFRVYIGLGFSVLGVLEFCVEGSISTVGVHLRPTPTTL